MSKFDFVNRTKISSSVRARQLEAIFDVPRAEVCEIAYKGELPDESEKWNIGLIVGPSGCGKSSIVRQVYGDEQHFDWGGACVIDDFAKHLSMDEISKTCQAVGFNTIPAWLRPHAVLSNGEKFRADLARRLLETKGTIVVDEFTSVVDRQVAQIGSHAVQKYVRKTGKKFVAASCHYDIVDWLQPDWIFEPATGLLTRRSLRGRPKINCQIARVHHSTWSVFAPFHYLTASLANSAKCFVLSVEGRMAAFAGIMYRPHARVRNVYGCSRLVTLPDFQGLGLAFALIDRLGAIHMKQGKRLHTYPAHPALIRGFDNSPAWRMTKRPGTYSPAKGTSSSVDGFGGRPCAVFEYCGSSATDDASASLLN
jgi:ABC-type lipoprotein export system ATPase subunit